MTKTTARIYLIFFLLFAIVSDSDSNTNSSTTRDYRQDMRDFVQAISAYGEENIPNFIIIPQNGQEIVTQSGEEDGVPATEYLNAIDGVGREDLFYGYDKDNKPTPEEEKNYMMAFLDICEQYGIEVLTTDYCSSYDKVDDSYKQNEAKNYISFASPQRELNIIPDYPSEPYNVNSFDIQSLANSKNFLYLINPENYTTKQDFITAVSQTDYDIIIMDCFFNNQEFTASEINSLKTKKNSGLRIVISYMSIGEVEDYRYYWQDSWINSPPSWLEDENPDWEGNYKVRYWDKDWQSIIYGNDNSYLKKIINAGFDGVYLDIIDAFEYFENQESNGVKS